MLKQGDWVKIEYGDHAGCYGKVAAVNRNGSYKILPYSRVNQPGPMADIDRACLSELKPYMVSRDELKEIGRAEKTYRDYALSVFPIFNIRAEKNYRLRPADIAAAIKNINNGDDPLNGFKEWFWLIQNVFYEDLEIKDRYNEELFSDSPLTEDELFSTVFSLTENLYWKLEERFVSREDSERFVIRFEDSQPWNDEYLFGRDLEFTAYKAVCEDIISRVRIFEYNRFLPREKWEYSPSQKRHIINSYETDEELKNADPKAKAQYRKFVLDLCGQDDVQAMKILAWGYYNGDSIYRQSFLQARKYLNMLYLKSGDPFAANALGYIYYYGSASKGVPDYEKAFHYFSYGALAGIDESIYKCGDMLIEGLGTVRNIDMGMNLIVDGYKDTMFRFSDGEYDNRFAEYAFRMGNICRKNLIFGMNVRDAYKFYLEAEFAVLKRSEKGEMPRDTLLLNKIRDAKKELFKEYHPDPDRNQIKADFPIYISHIFEDRFPIKITIGRSKGKYYLKMGRFRLIPGDEPKILVTFPELSYVDLVSELKFGLEDVGVIKYPENRESFLADGFTRNEHTNALEFYFGGECIAAVEAKWFVIDITNEQKKKLR